MSDGGGKGITGGFVCWGLAAYLYWAFSAMEAGKSVYLPKVFYEFYEMAGKGPVVGLLVVGGLVWFATAFLGRR